MCGSATRVSAIIIAISGLLSVPTKAELRVEDFEVGTHGGFDFFFIHDLRADEVIGEGPRWEFTDVASVSPNHSLFLYPGADYVTFRSLEVGEFVDYAEVWMTGNLELTAPLTFHVLGFDTAGAPLDWMITEHPTNAEWVFASTEGQGFGKITEIRLTTPKEGMFDDLAVNVIPEPATLGLLTLSLLGFLPSRLRRRRR